MCIDFLYKILSQTFLILKKKKSARCRHESAYLHLKYPLLSSDY